MKSIIAYNRLWGDEASNQRISDSDKGQAYQEAEIDNILRDLALRFERSPSQSTLKLWASDLASMGHKALFLKPILKTIPYKMDKHPTLNEILALIKPHLAQDSFLVDELTDLSNRCFDHLKEKFLKLADQSTLTKMSEAYAKHVFPFCEHFTERHKEMLVLNDWLRSYFKPNPQAILDQGRISNDAFDRRDKDYFINPLKSYAKTNNL